jgi:hypothetical protein
MKIDINNPAINDLLKNLRISSLDDWNDDKRFDDSVIERLKSSDDLMNRIATHQEAVTLFYLFLGRYLGDERAGRKYIDILHELSNSEEYNNRKLTHQLHKYGSVIFKHKDGDIDIRANGDSAHGQAIYSCHIEYISDSLIITLPKNTNFYIFESRFIPFIPIFFETIKILKTIKSKTRAIEFFYGDHPTRDSGLAFCSNKVNDFLLPDSDTLPIFKNPPSFKYTPWEGRKPSAYFRGSDTGSAYYMNVNKSQRMLLCSLSQLNPDLIDAKITNCENKNNIENYKEKGVWGEREPLSNIGLYKYNIDVDGNSNSWAGLVNKLLGGFGGVTLKVESPEGYRQWFYHRLQPWINYVPITADLSDIIDKISFLQKNDGIAFGIQNNAAEIFRGIDYGYLRNFSAHIIVSALLRLR